ncbi:MAG: Uncharacterised protein [Prochlorococcus marinus str. MIT 9313]|nr:MAG: Uncharacterised protein [Prochlorococcus marinus str. MIT 9313]
MLASEANSSLKLSVVRGSGLSPDLGLGSDPSADVISLAKAESWSALGFGRSRSINPLRVLPRFAIEAPSCLRLVVHRSREISPC